MAELKILLITKDEDVFIDGSLASERMKRYGAILEELHILVICSNSSSLQKKELGKNVWAYPVSSSVSYFSSDSAASLGKKIVFDRKFTRGKSVIIADDPFESGQAGLNIRNRWKLPLEVDIRIDPGTLGFWQKGSVKNLLNKASAVGVETKAMADLIKDKFGISSEKILINRPYIDAGKVEEGKIVFDLRARYGWHFALLAVGDLTKENDFPTAIKALAKVRAYFPDAGLAIVGSGPEKAELESLVKSLGLKANVSIVDREENMATYYKTADIYIQTTKVESFRQEIIEAGACGLSIVTTPVGFASELEDGKEAIFYPANDSEYLFKAIYDLLENSDLRENLRNNIRTAMKTKLPKEEAFLSHLKSNWDHVAGMIQAS